MAHWYKSLHRTCFNSVHQMPTARQPHFSGCYRPAAKHGHALTSSTWYRCHPNPFYRRPFGPGIDCLMREGHITPSPASRGKPQFPYFPSYLSCTSSLLP